MRPVSGKPPKEIVAVGIEQGLVKVPSAAAGRAWTSNAPARLLRGGGTHTARRRCDLIGIRHACVVSVQAAIHIACLAEKSFAEPARESKLQGVVSTLRLRRGEIIWRSAAAQVGLCNTFTGIHKLIHFIAID